MTVVRMHRLRVLTHCNRHVAMVCALMPLSRRDADHFFPPLLQEFTP